MRLTALAGLFLCAIIFLASPSVHADPLDLPKMESESVPVTLKTISENDKPGEEAPATTPADAPPQPVEHTVAAGETLSKIAEVHKTSWKRIYDKNTQVNDPDLINAGDKLVIPTPEEELTERPVPQNAEPEAPVPSNPAPVRAAPQTAAPKATTKPASSPRGSSAGNSYYYGYCTWYAKNKRPDLPNNLGNANTWVARAASQGYATGSAPRVGAIGQQGMHVVFVESVNSNGTVTVSEMNYEGYAVVSSRTVPASTFMYIY